MPRSSITTKKNMIAKNAYVNVLIYDSSSKLLTIKTKDNVEANVKAIIPNTQQKRAFLQGKDRGGLKYSTSLSESIN